MKNQSTVRDERTLVVENASYRWAYLLLSFGLLADIAYRGFQRQDSNWDLMALVLLGGLVATLYQAIHKVLTLGWALTGVMMVLVGIIIAQFPTVFSTPLTSIGTIVIAVLIGAALIRFLR